MALSLGEIVARNLRRLRQERGVTQEELAYDVGINRNYVGMIERCQHSPTVAMIERLAKALKVDPIVFFRRDKS